MPPIAAEPFDVYIAAARDGGRWLYLTPARAPSVAPATLARGTSGQPFGGLWFTVRGVQPGGWYMFRVQFVRASAVPARKHYVFQPLLATVRVAPRRDNESRAALGRSDC